MSRYDATRIERALIGSMMVRGEGVKIAKAIVDPEHFFSDVHKVLFIGLCEMDDEGLEPDMLLLGKRLEKIGYLERVGGYDYLIDVAEEGISVSVVDHYAKELVDAWAFREYGRLADLVEEGADLDTLRIHAERIGHRTALKGAPAVIGRIGQFGSKPKEGVSSGYRIIDWNTACKGYPAGQMSIVSAYQKSGKTAWMLNSAIHAAKHGRRPLYATFADMDGHELEYRAFKHVTGRGSEPLEDPETWHSETRGFNESWHIDVYDAAGLDSGYDIETFAAWLSARPGVYTEVYVDYAQELRSRDKRVTSEYTEASVCASLIQRLAKRTGLPFIVGSQITEGRQGERDKTKGSRVWEEKAGLVLRIKRDEDCDMADVSIPFSRFGAKCERRMRWLPQFVKFEDIDQGSTWSGTVD